MMSAEFHDAFIMAGNPAEPVLGKQELRRECERRQKSAAALRAVAEYIFRHSALFAVDGPNLLTAEQAAQRKKRIEELGQKIELMAASTSNDSVTYYEFESLLGELHKLGFFPETSLVSAVARAFVDS
jgi:hypothetical protein